MEITTTVTKFVNRPIKLVLLFLEFVTITTPATLHSQYSDYAMVA